MRTGMLLCTMLVFAMLLPTSAFAQEKQKGKHHSMKGKWAQLELTPEQVSKLKELREGSAPARKEHREKVREVRGKIKEELLKDRPSQRVLDDYAAQMGDLHEKLNTASINHLLQVKEILTPEQFKIFTEKGPKGGPGAHIRKHRGDGAPDSMKCKHGETRMRKHKGGEDCDKSESGRKKKGERSTQKR